MGDVFTVIALVSFVVAVILTLRLLRSTVAASRRLRRSLVAAALTWIGAFVLSVFTWSPPAVDVSRSADGQPQMSVAGYTQTWPKSYASTSCAEFSDEMTSSQRFAAAADMLTLVWMKIETTDDHPGEALIDEYSDAVEKWCRYPEERIVEAAWAVWINDERFAA